MSESIVVGTDGSETAQHAVVNAARLAKALGGEVHVVMALNPIQSSYAAVSQNPGALIWALVPESEAQPMLEQAAAAIRAAGAKVHTHVHQSDPCEALIDGPHARARA